MIDVIVLSSIYALYIGHIYELLFQNHYDRNGWWFITKISIDPLTLALNAFYFREVLTKTTIGTYALYGLISEFFIHIFHFVLILSQSTRFYKNGKRPLWLSVLFNTVDIVVIIFALYPISEAFVIADIVTGVVYGTIFVLTLYRLS